MWTSETKSAASAQSLRARRTGSGCSMDSSIRSLCQRMRWHSSMMILIATLGSRSRWERKSSRRSTNNSVVSPAVASAVREKPSSTATSTNRSPVPMKFRVRRLPSEAPVSIRIWPRRTPNRASPGSPFWNSISPAFRFWVWQRLEIRASSSGPRSANIGFIFRMTANSAALLIAMPSGMVRTAAGPKSSKYGGLQNRLPGKCVISHITLPPTPIIFGGFEPIPVSGIDLRKRRVPTGGATFDAVCPVRNIVMRAWKIAGSAIAAVIVLAVLLLIVGVPSGFLTSAIQSRVEAATGYRLSIAGSTRIGLWPSLSVTMNDVTLQHPKDRDGSNRLTVDSVQADVTLASIWSGHPQVTDLVIVRPVMHVPLLRERSGPLNPPLRQPASGGEADDNSPAINHLTVTDGAIEFSSLRDRVTNRIDGIHADAAIGSDRKIRITGSARAGEHPLKFDIGASAPAHLTDRQNIPVEFKLDAPGLLQAPLSAKAEVRLNGAVVMINGLSGAVGDRAFNGWASVDTSSKPLVKLDLDFQRLDLAASARTAPQVRKAHPRRRPCSTAGATRRSI